PKNPSRQLVLPRSQTTLVQDCLNVVQVPVRSLRLRHNLGVRRAEAPLADCAETDFTRQTQARDRCLDRGGLHTRVDERAERHVPRDPAEAIELCNPHARGVLAWSVSFSIEPAPGLVPLPPHCSPPDTSRKLGSRLRKIAGLFVASILGPFHPSD